MTAREIVKARLNHETTQVTPYTVSCEPDVEARLTAYYGDEQWRRKKLRKFTCAYLNVDNVGMRALDDTYSRDAWGALWRMDKKPWHLEKPPLEAPSLENYEMPSLESFVGPILSDKAEAIRLYENDTEHYRIINMGWGIFEHSWRLRGFENALADMLADEDFYAGLTSKIADLYVGMLKACDDVPADAYLFGDDWGDQRGIIFGPERWRKFIKPCWERIYREVHRQGKKAIQHCCGSVADIYGDLIEIGLDCHESVQPEARGMAPELLKAKWGGKISFWGCLGSQSVLNSGAPAEIRDEILRLCALFKDGGGYILSPAKPLMDNMGTEEAVAVIETLAGLNPEP